MSETNSKPQLAAVIFDMDGLMFDSERIVQLSWNRAGERLGYPNLGDNIYNTLGMNAARRKVYFEETYGKDFPFEAFQENSRYEFQREVNLYGLPMKPGLMELLDYLEESGIPAVVATSSSREYALGNLKRANVLDYFQSMITGNMVTNSKPDPEIYLKACQSIGVDPSCCIALEDAPNGIRSAHAAGLTTILIPDLIRDFSDIQDITDIRLDSLHDVIDYIQQNY